MHLTSDFINSLDYCCMPASSTLPQSRRFIAAYTLIIRGN